MGGATLPDGATLSLGAWDRCARTGAPMRGQCAGHVDFYSTYFVWTRHYWTGLRFKVVPYDHPAPEVIHDQPLAAA